MVVLMVIRVPQVLKVSQVTYFDRKNCRIYIIFFIHQVMWENLVLVVVTVNQVKKEKLVSVNEDD